LRKEREREMVAKNKATTGKGQVKKLKLKKETIRDLGTKGKDVKGGGIRPFTGSCHCYTTPSTCPEACPGYR
jgi:hypothetical protein